jgi:CspA family cold shock protein
MDSASGRRVSNSNQRIFMSTATAVVRTGISKGSVKWFNDSKGYGFISEDIEGKDYFVHFSSIVGQDGRRTLREDDRVAFDIEKTDRGFVAANVSVVR